MQSQLSSKTKQWALICGALIAILINVLPVVKYAVPYKIAALFLGALLVVLLFCSNRLTTTALKVAAAALVPAILYGLVTFPGDFDQLVNEFIALMRIFIAAALGYILVTRLNRKQQVFLFWAFSAIIALVIVNTLIALNEDPLIARLLASGSNDDFLSQYRNQNVGGFGLVYGIGLLAPALLLLALDCQKLWVKLSLLAAVVLIGYFVIQTQYFTCILLTFLGIVMALTFLQKKSIWKWIFGILLILLAFNFIPICEFLYNNTELGMIHYKLKSVLDFFSDAQISDLGKRPQFLWDSFLNFLNSPIWGSTASYNGVQYYALTSHSFFIGLLEATGLLGLVGAVFVFRYTRQTAVSGLREQQYEAKYFLLSYGLFILLSVVNPTLYLYETHYLLLVYIPLCVSVIKGYTPKGSDALPPPSAS